MKADFGAITQRFDATLQLSGALWIRSHSRTHRHGIGFCSEEHVILPAVFLRARGLTHDTARWIHRHRWSRRNSLYLFESAELFPNVRSVGELFVLRPD
jgi:hypothetical protein